MTLMLASVTSPVEAEAVRAGGADIIDMKNPADGALGALDVQVAAQIVRAIGGRKLVSAAAGASHISPDAARASADAMAATGTDYVKVGISSDEMGAACIRALGSLAGETRLVGVMFADRAPDLALLKLMAQHGFSGAMLDTATKGAGRLLDYLGVAALHEFVDRCREAGLMSGLAGSLEAPDVPRLLPLRPDTLGFRGALCHGRAREAEIDAAALRLIRDLIPHEFDGRSLADEPRGDLRPFPVRAHPSSLERPHETDKVFVHDLVMPCFIGAYDFERGTRQNVQFNVDVDVRRVQTRTDDMRGIFSYDLIIDAIKIILGRGHIDLIETLASDLAEMVLHHASVVRVSARVEKLDVVSGAVGVEIKRERVAGVATIDQLFSGMPDQAGTASGH